MGRRLASAATGGTSPGPPENLPQQSDVAPQMRSASEGRRSLRCPSAKSRAAVRVSRLP